ncbi:MAG: vancomycin high temperature exclusion protein [bacterium]
MKKKSTFSLLRYFFIVCSFVVLFVFVCNAWIVLSTHDRVYSEITGLPESNVGLVLGTSKYVKTGVLNLHFLNRLAAAAQLYHQGKVKHIIVSGDNAEKWHDEPTDMKEELMAHGVPDSAITRDYAGLRTLDSVVRAKKIFGQNAFILVTDEFHTYRAIFLFDNHHIKAIAYD